MLLEDIKLLESVTFSVTTTEDHPKYGKVHTPVGKDQMVPCWACDGKGVEAYVDPEDDNAFYNVEAIDELPEEIRKRLKPIECDLCHGEGKYKDFIADGPEMNLSNRNAMVLLNLLGVEEDYAGTIWNKDLPELRRHIVKVLNSDDIQKAVIDRSETGGEITDRRAVKGDDGVDRIVTRRSPKMIDLGLPEEQIKRYFRDILEMIDYAQKNNYNLGWS